MGQEKLCAKKRKTPAAAAAGASKKSRKYVSSDENEELKKLETVSMSVQRKSGRGEKDVRTKAVSARREKRGTNGKVG